jgi:hypothetical protein
MPINGMQPKTCIKEWKNTLSWYFILLYGEDRERLVSKVGKKRRLKFGAENCFVAVIAQKGDGNFKGGILPSAAVQAA